MSGCNTPERTWATDDGETTVSFASQAHRSSSTCSTSSTFFRYFVLPRHLWQRADDLQTFTPLPYITVVPGGGHTSPPTTRPTTPSIFSRRLSVANSPEPKSPTASMFSGRHGPQSKANDKGKAPMHEQRLGESSHSTWNFDVSSSSISQR